MLTALPYFYAERCRHYESMYLSACLRDLRRGYNAAVMSKLESTSFAFGPHRWLFGIVCQLADRGVKVVSHDLLAGLNRVAGYPFPAYGRLDAIGEIYCAEIVQSGVERWAQRVAQCTAVRKLERDKAEAIRAAVEELCAA